MKEANVWILGITVSIIALVTGAVKGCSIVYDPASLKADADARIALHKEFHDVEKEK